MVRTTFAGLLAGLALAAPAAAAPVPGTLDTSFSGDGKVATAFAGGPTTGGPVALQPDGKLLVGGTVRVGDRLDVALARYTVGGALDTSFSGDGKVTLNLRYDWSEDDPGASAAHLGLQPDGKIVLYAAQGGCCVPYGYLVRFLPNGTVDASFSGQFEGPVAGSLLVDIETAADMAMGADGRIYLAGETQMTAGRFGGYVYAYGRDGARIGGHLSEGADYRALTVQPDGRVVAAGNQSLVRLMPDLTDDPTFASGHPYGIWGVHSLAVQPDGGIIGSGTDGGNQFLERRLPGGALDTSWGTGGRVTVDFGGADGAGPIVIQPNGRIVVAGTTSGPSSDLLTLTRRLPSGALDPSFSGDGKLAVSFAGFSRAYATGVALHGNGRIVAGAALAVSRTTTSAKDAIGAVRVFGDTVATCAGRAPTVTGAGLLLGGPGPDVIAGSTGRDALFGHGGGDVLCGGDGPDRLDGGAGQDFLYGLAGDDQLFGGADGDRLDGGTGTDAADGGAGTDAGVNNESQSAIP